MKKTLFFVAIALSMFQMNAQDFGGKYLKKTSEFKGKPFVFSNRGETEAIEKMAAAYNNLDAKAITALTAEKVKVTDFEGNKLVMTSKEWEAYFSGFKSLNWEVSAILPVRIKDTDPSSGVVVFSTETRVSKDGKVWKKELVEFFSFNLDMKIDGITQFYQDIK
jgi:hypothetical protein